MNIPHGARRFPRGAPPGLIHVQTLAGAHALCQILIRVFERPRDAPQDRLDRPGAEARPEQLFGELHHITTRDAVAHRQRRYGRLEAWAEGAGGEIGGQHRARLLTTAGTAYARATVLDQSRGDHRQLFDLVAHRLPYREKLTRVRRPIHGCRVGRDPCHRLGDHDRRHP